MAVHYVGIPCTGHPYSVGDTITIAGTTNYDGTYTAAAGTTTNKIVIAHAYAAETFAGTETTVRTRTTFNDTLTINGAFSMSLATDTPRTLTFHGVGGAVDITVAIGR
jgi:hypothetical protein